MRLTRGSIVRTHCRCHGLILLEVLIAFVILSASLSVLLQVTGSSISRQRSVDNHLRAVSHAANVLADLELTHISANQINGEVDEVYRWRASFEPLSTTQKLLDDSEAIAALMAINIEIKWRENGRDKSYQLNTKRIIMNKR